MGVTWPSMIPAMGGPNPPTAGAKGRWKPPPPRTASSALESRIAVLLSWSIARLQQRRRAALEVAEIVRTLDADEEVVLAAMLQPLLEDGFIDREAARSGFGRSRAAGARLERAGRVRPAGRLDAGAGARAGSQAEALRKMLRGRHRRCAAGGGQARRAAAAHARGQDARAAPTSASSPS